MPKGDTPQHREEDIIAKKLGEIRHQIEDMEIPESTYAGIGIEGNTVHIAHFGEDEVIFSDTSVNDKQCGIDGNGGACENDIIKWFNEVQEDESVKFISAGIAGKEHINSLGSRLWLEEDIVPYVLSENGDDVQERARRLVHEVELRFNELNIAKIQISDSREVLVDDLVDLDAYKEMMSKKDFDKFTNLADEFGDRTIRFFSATPRGGGVALMRHALVRLARLLDIDMHWHVLSERAEAFDVTKTKFHNVLQAVADPDTELTEKDKKIYNDWIDDNAEAFAPVIKDSDIIVIDDPQPSGMIPHIKEMNPQAPILYRSHIQLMTDLMAEEGAPQHKTWQFLWENIKQADNFIAHPKKEFIPENVPEEKVIQMPPTTDRLDGLNKPLSDQQKVYYMKQFNKVLLEHDQTPLDHSRPYIIQIARFDPSKGIPDVLESFRHLREKLGDDELTPQLVITGHGSVDDPDGVPVFNLIMDILQQDDYADIREDIKVARLHHTDQILNVLMREARVALQLSHREGFEIKVTEGLEKGIPMIAYEDAGGIPLQIEDEKGGYLVEEIGDTEAVAKHLYNLLTDEKLYKQMSKAAKENIRDDVFTTDAMKRWLSIALNAEKGVVSKER